MKITWEEIVSRMIVNDAMISIRLFHDVPKQDLLFMSRFLESVSDELRKPSRIKYSDWFYYVGTNIFYVHRFLERLIDQKPLYLPLIGHIDQLQHPKDAIARICLAKNEAEDPNPHHFVEEIEYVYKKIMKNISTIDYERFEPLIHTVVGCKIGICLCEEDEHEKD